MLEGINIPENREKIAIVVVGYNRIAPLQRLLVSLLNAHYPSRDIPIVISIDASGNETLYNYVLNFVWPYGTKYVNIQKKRLGLCAHIFQCGNFTEYFRAIILLEDDIFIAPYFYSYIQQAVEAYGEDELIGQIALYNTEKNWFTGLPFQKLVNGADVYLYQEVESWGQCWTSSMWKNFVEWRDSYCTPELIQSTDMPEAIKSWKKAWSPYYYAYMVRTGRYAVCPNIGFSTCFGDCGEHGSNTNLSTTQICISLGDVKYRMPSTDKLVKYDCFCNNESLYCWLGLDRKTVCLDVYGIHHQTDKRYLLSPFKLPYKKVRSFGLAMRPIELNVHYNIEGEGLYLYEIPIQSTMINISKKSSPYFLFQYYESFYNWRYFFLRITISFCGKIKRGIKRIFSK